MKKSTALSLLALLLIWLSLPSDLSAVSRGIRVVPKNGQELYLYKDYHALVIGISDYERWPDLPNAVKDAQEVAQALERIGFQAKVVSNPNSSELQKALNELTYKLGQEANRPLLFYYVGHGETESLADGTKMGYIIPRACQ